LESLAEAWVRKQLVNELADSQGKDCLLFGVLGADVDKKMEQRTGETLEILTINGADEPDNSAVLQSIAYFGKEEIGVCKDRRIKFTYFTPTQFSEARDAGGVSEASGIKCAGAYDREFERSLG